MPEEQIPFAIIGTNAVNVLMTVVAVSWLQCYCPFYVLLPVLCLVYY